jgi:hypothetical protein
MNSPKYSRPEIERRWLVDSQKAEPLLVAARQVIRDKYLPDAQLRLRRVTNANGNDVYKFCKKYGDRQDFAESISNLYLSSAEYILLDQLPGAVVSKTRHPQAVGAIDVYLGAASDLYIFEVEFSSVEAAARFEPPEFVDREITGDALLSGRALASLWAHPQGIVVGPATPADFPKVLSLNESAVPHVNSIDLRELEALAEQSLSFTVARDGDEMAGFLLVLGDGEDYASPNYRYFSCRYPSFAYVDRIVVSQGHRGAGIGSLLYSQLLVHGVAGQPLLACEVNLRPPNPASVAFHEHLGFAGIAEQDTDAGRKRVLLMIKELKPAS